jgi:sigma-B regulation protein RsbU (phosphoserine phosphatase)
MRSLFRSQAPEIAPAVEPVPTIFPKLEGADIAAVFAGTRVAGDFYDSVRVSPERVLFGMLDVAGLRDDTRNILSAAQEIFRKVGCELFSGTDVNESDAMSDLCLRINRGLIDAAAGVRSCPAFIACYHEKFGTLCYSNGGHTPGLLRDSTGVTQLPSTGLPLGLFSHTTCEAPTIGLEKGAALLLVSRGLVECEARRGKTEFGLERIKDFLQSAPHGGARDLCVSTLDAVAKFAAGAPLCDDRTALALVRSAS